MDTCTAPPLAALTAWRGTSPYTGVNIYFGGRNRGCAQPELTTAWVRSAAAAGWSLVPTYFGDQPFCVFGSKPYRFTATGAAARGSADGTDAAARARSLGVLAGSALYADVEHYDRTNASCVAAVRTYSYPGQVSVSTPVNTRSGPGTSYTNLNQPLQGGALAYVACQKPGSLVGTTRVWNQLVDGRWVSDYYVSNRSNTTYSQPVPRCP
jgi:hypothetical protein